MSFPDPSLPAPALTPYQLSFNSVAFGGLILGSPYQSVKINGLDMAAIQSGDTKRAVDQGEFVGVDSLEGRDIAIDIVLQADSTSLDHARQALGGAFAIAGATERPLFLQLPSGTFACMARPRKYAFTWDIDMALAGAAVANLLLHATDPRWYSSPSKTVTVGLPAPLGGLTFPVTFPASFGGGGVGGLIPAWNFGTLDVFPELIITGPCTNPSISNLSIPGAPRITFGIALNAGDTLTIDTDFHSAVYTTAGSTVGAPRDNTVLSGSTWWGMPPGLNTLEFNTSDGTQVAGTLTVNWADAYNVL